MRNALLLALTLALVSVPARANTVSTSFYSDNATFTPSGRHFDLASSFTVPLFDPSLGVLNFMSFDVTVYAGMDWETISRSNSGAGFTDFDITTVTSLLGVVETHAEGPVFGGGGPGCGTAAQPQACSPTNSQVTDSGGIEVYGKAVANGTLSLGQFPHGQQHSVYSGPATMDLAAFTGLGSLNVPIAFAVDAAPSYTDELIYGVKIGNILRAGLLYHVDWAYDYTPAPIVASPTVTPEPRTTVLIGGLLAACAFLGRRRSLSV